MRKRDSMIGGREAAWKEEERVCRRNSIVCTKAV